MARSSLLRNRSACFDSQNEPSHKKATTDDNKDRRITLGEERNSLSAAERTLGVNSVNDRLTTWSAAEIDTVNRMTEKIHEANSMLGPSIPLSLLSSVALLTALSRASSTASSLAPLSRPQNGGGRKEDTSPSQGDRRPQASAEKGPRQPPMLATVRCRKKRRRRNVKSLSLLELTVRRLNKVVAAEDRNRLGPSSGRVEATAIPPLHLCSFTDGGVGFMKASREVERSAGWLPVRRKQDRRTFSKILTTSTGE